MAYVYCKDCGWKQDDFWEWKWTWKFWKWRAFGYNPIQCVVDEIKFWIIPRFVNYCVPPSGVVEKRFSWFIMIEEIIKIIRRAKDMRWKTIKEFQLDKDKRCPRCGSKNLEID